MKIYHWSNTKFNEQYAGGDIIVLAEDIESARKQAVKKYQDELDEWSHIDKTEKMNIFLRDIKEEPSNPTTIFISGSS